MHIAVGSIEDECLYPNYYVCRGYGAHIVRTYTHILEVPRIKAINEDIRKIIGLLYFY